MKALSKCLGLMLASMALASCGGGGGSGSHGSFEPTPSGSLTVVPTSVQLPINRDNVAPFLGSPFLGEIDVTWRRANGDLVSGTDINVTISPVQVASFSMLDDPETAWSGADKNPPTAEGNEFLTLLGSGPVHTEGGHATIFVHSSSITGTATLTITARDPQSNTTISKTVPVTVVSNTPQLPAAIELTTTPNGVYLQGSGGNSFSQIVTRVVDGNGQNVPNPVSGNTAFNNVLLEVVGSAGSGTITANDASGVAQNGASVKTRTLQGIANANYAAGSVQGPIQIRATTDAADNNVDNGITTPVSVVENIVVSDGKLFSLEITSPNVAAIKVNSVSGNVDTVDAGGGVQIPPDPDGTYSLTVSVIAKDRQGNPVLPGTQIRFGAIDEPVGIFGTPNAGQFLIAGGDGNPQESGKTFTAPTGHFKTAGGGAGPGDALVIFGKDVQGNSDLESAVTVQTVNTETNLTAVTVFNPNNTTGSSVDYGPVLPYVIGRAEHGNVSAVAATNDIGVASTTLNYPVTALGRPVVVWAQGESPDPLTGGSRRVTDAADFRYAGLAPGTLTANPTPIFGNKTQIVTVCVEDALHAPLQFLPIGFRFTLNGGTGTVDGNANPGMLDNLTGPNGCVDATVVTSGVPGSNNVQAGSGKVTFFVGGLSADVIIVVNIAALQVSPSFVHVPAVGIVTQITVKALDQDGKPLSGVNITGSCTASGGAGATIGLNPGSGITNANGIAVFTSNATGFVQPGDPPTTGTGQCTFTTDTGLSGATTFGATVTCDDFSPPDPQCDD